MPELHAIPASAADALETARALLHSALVRRLAELDGVLFYHASLQSGDLVWTDELFVRWGYRAEEVRPHASWWLENTHPDDVERVTGFLAEALAGGRDRWSLSYRFRRADGGWADLEGNASLVRDADGVPIATEGAVRDVSVQRAAERAVRDSEAEFRFLVEASRELVCRHRPDGRYTYASPSLREITGWAPEDLLGHDPYRFFHPDDHEHIQREGHRIALAGELGRTGVEYRFLRADGSYVWLETLTRPLADETGAVTGLITYSRDVTERRERASAREQGEKMAILARAAGGISHEFNNLLATVRGHAELLRAGATDAEERQALSDVLVSADRGAALTRQLLAFTEQEVVRRESLELGTVAVAVADVLRQEWGASPVIDVVTTADAWVLADRQQVEQVIRSLCQNARESMPTGGTLSIRVAERTDLTDATSGPARWCTLVVADAGHGMTPDVLERAMEPFFTTKRDTGGSGLGLPTALRIVQECGGRVRIDSAPGTGTTVECIFPAVPRPAVPVAAEQEGPETPGLRILLVDDEPLVRRVARRMLERSGFTVLEAVDGAAALELLEAGPLPDLLLTDLVMPRLDGRGLEAAVTQRFPGLPVVFMTGYAGDTGVPERGRPVVTKPFSIETLLSSVRATLRAA